MMNKSLGTPPLKPSYDCDSRDWWGVVECLCVVGAHFVTIVVVIIFPFIPADDDEALLLIGRSRCRRHAAANMFIKSRRRTILFY